MLRRRWLLVLAMACIVAVRPVPAAEPVVIYAAASLTDALQAVEAGMRGDPTLPPVQLVFAASSALARQIEAGARADLFFSADTEWVDYLDARGRLRAGGRRDLLSNRLVLVAPADRPVELRLLPGVDVATALGPRGRLALGDPDIVPAGRYARAALTSLGAWPAVAGRLVPAENVRVALAYVARGEVPLGVVYASDAAAEPRVRVVDTFPADSHPPIVYPLVVTATATPATDAVFAYLAGPQAQDAYRRAGFLFTAD